jgi:hypothetical protein
MSQSVLKPLAEGIWVADAERSVLGSRQPIRSVVLDVGGSALVHSPVPLSPELEADLSGLPPVRFIVAPNRWHHLYVGEWTARYPQAELHGAPGLREKRPDLRFSAELGDAPAPGWSAHVEQLLYSAMPLFNEVVFFHRPSRSLVLTDLAFNFQEADWGVAGLYIRAAGAYRKFGPSRVTRRLIRDRALGRQLMDRILSWPFERVIMSHGAIVETQAKERLRAAFEFLWRP